MKYLFIIVFSLFGSFASATTYYVATNGSDSNPGTITQPFATWQKGFNTAVAGDIVYIRGGVYSPASTNHGGIYCGVYAASRNGTSVNPIKIMNYPGEVPILDGVNIIQAGIHFGVWMQYCHYWELTGLWIRNVKEYNNGANYSGSIQINDCSHFLFDRFTVSTSGEGFELGSNTDYVTYKNCDAIDNRDLINQGDYTNGFGGTISAGMHVAHIGCRAWGNSDDGYDYAGSAGGIITWDNCWSFNNGNGPRGNGVGFKIGMAVGAKESGPQRILRNCVAFNNLSLGFDEAQDQSNYAAIEHNLFNCTSYHNGSDGYSFNYPSSTVDKIQNCISFQDTYLGTISAGNINNHNSWTIVTPTAADFVSLDYSGATGSRAADGSLPDITFLHLAATSAFIGVGIDVGLPFPGNAPDIGAFQTGIIKDVQTSTYVSSSVENSAPAVLVMNYDLSLANIVPTSAAFGVMVNSVARPVNQVTISGTKVSLTLSSSINTGDVITVSYTAPATNPLQTSSGGVSLSLSAKTVTNNVNAAMPVYVSSAVQNSTPNNLEMTYNTSLASVVPAATAFSVMVNSVARPVTTVAVSGTKVTLTVAVAIAAGDLVTVSYTKPATNPLQTTAGNQPASITAQTVNNNVTSMLVYVSSVVQDATPANLEITYNSSLASVVPAASAFVVLVNSVGTAVNSVAVSGTKVILTLSKPVLSGDIVSVSYTKPATNPIQTLAGAQAASISAQITTNNVVSTSTSSARIDMTIYPNPVHNIVNVNFVYTNFDSGKDATLSPEILRIYDMSGRLFLDKLLTTGIDHIKFPINLRSGIYTVNLYCGSLQMASKRIIVY